ncbi:MAG: ABC transporter permease [Planctomycetota bacterium]
MVRNIAAVAINTFREAVRDRILHVLLLGGVIMILGSYAIGYAAIPTATADTAGPNAIQMEPYLNDRNKVIEDVCLGTMWALNVVICVFIGTGMIYKEIDKRTLFTVLTKPIERFEFILGKYAGLALTVLMLCAALGAVFLVYLYCIVGSVDGGVVQELGFLALEMLLITAIAIAYGAVSTPILSAVMTTFTVFIGENVRNIVELSRFGTYTGAQKWLYTVELILPNLQSLNHRNDAVWGFMQPWSVFGGAVIYTAAYVSMLLIVACVAFRNRSF